MTKRPFYQTLFLLLILSYNAVSQPFTFDSSTSFGGKTYLGGGFKSTVDPSGNIYVIGEFQGTRSFGTFQLTSTGVTDIFVAMFDPTGVAQWAIHAGTPMAYTSAGGIVYNAGALYIVGSFTGQLTLGNNNVTSSGQTDIFVAQLDPSSGFNTWLIKAGGINGDAGSAICTDAAGGFYISGLFTGNAQFGSQNVNSGNSTNANSFIAKYDAIGNCQWVQQGGSAFGQDAAYSMTELSNTNVVITGVFDGAATFGSIVLTPVLAQDIFIVCYNSSGVVQWAKKGAGKGGDISNSIKRDGQNNIFITGTVGDTAYFDGNMIPGNGLGTFFLVKYNASGTFQWGKRAASSSANSGLEMATDTSGSCYVVGSCGVANFSGTVLTGAPGFIAKYSTTGGLTWVTRIPAPNVNTFSSILLPPSGGGYCYLFGEYNNSITIGSTTLTAAVQNQPELFLTRLGGGTVGFNELSTEVTDFSVFPNPATEITRISAGGIRDEFVSVDLMTLDGKLVVSEVIHVENGRIDHSIQLGSIEAGHYIIQLNTSSGTISSKFVKL